MVLQAVSLTLVVEAELLEPPLVHGENPAGHDGSLFGTPLLLPVLVRSSVERIINCIQLISKS